MREHSKTISPAALLSSIAFLVSGAVILRSRPFLKLPYDMWHHLMLIRGWYLDGAPIVTRPGVTYHEVLWHRLWAGFFKLIAVADVFSWAKIIHCSQFAWTLGCLTYFTNAVIKYGMENVQPANRRLWSLFGAWCFVFGAGTFSVQYQLSWIMWYGVNYQAITLPAYFLSAGLLLDLILSKNGAKSIILISCLPLVFCLMVLIHPMEAGYFLIFLCFFVVFFAPEFLLLAKRSPITTTILCSPLLLAPFLLWVLPSLGVPLPRPAFLRESFSLSSLWENAFIMGANIQAHGFHRGLSSFNELAILGCALLAIVVILKLLRLRHEGGSLLDQKLRLLGLMLFTSVAFATGPRTAFPSGILALLTSNEQVWRFSLASPWFLGFTLWACFIAGQRLSLRKITIAVAPLVGIFCFSRFLIHGPFSATAMSVVKSLEIIDSHHVGVQYDRRALKALDSLILSTPPGPSGKQNIFLIRSDLQTYARASTGAYVLGDRLRAVSRDSFDEIPDRDQYKLIVIEAPADLPVDLEMAQAFPSMGLKIE